MRVLIIYATYSSGTLTVSELITDELKNNNHDVNMINAGDIDPSIISNYDLILLGSPSWLINNKDGQPHHLFFELMDRMKGMTFPEKKFAVFGLGDSAYARLCGAVVHLEEFVKTLQGTLVTPSLRVDSFYFDRPRNEELIKEWVVNLTTFLNDQPKPPQQVQS